MALSDDDVREILRIIDESPLEELRLETDGFSLYVRKGSVGAGPAAGPPSEAPAAEQATAAPVAEGADAAEAQQDGVLTIESPMLGTFYRAESPGSEPFVEVGSRVEPDSTVCIIEVMKMMNSVPAGVTGTIVEICQRNAELVEYGAPLFRVEPAP
jgi:acetyl-CoA carboxylase biotin carboxyl carrier protein